MGRIDARPRKASAIRVRFSKSQHRRRQRLSQTKVRSTPSTAHSTGSRARNLWHCPPPAWQHFETASRIGPLNDLDV